MEQPQPSGLAISPTELQAFHEAHFGNSAISSFANDFLPHHKQHPVGQTRLDEEDDFYYYDEEDDGLGYYDDGVKRTLTDEQIAMFRHSELESLRRAQESADSKAAASTTKSNDSLSKPGSDGQLSEGELPPESNASKHKKKKHKRRKAASVPEVKPDLRKRTWDVVETGLGSLDYGDESNDSAAVARLTQRRQITYDD